MPEDSLMKEIREAKDAYARSFNYDLDAIVADLQAADASGDRPVVRLSPRRPAGSSRSHVGPDLSAIGEDRFIGEAEAARELAEDQRQLQANGAGGLPDSMGRKVAESSSDRSGSPPGPRRTMSSGTEIDSPLRIEVGDAVALAVDIPAMGLTAGEVGAAVAIFDEEDGYKVEFRDHSGKNYASCTLHTDQLLLLHSRGQALRSGLHVV